MIAKMRNGRVNCSNGLVGQTGFVGHIGLIELISRDGHICITGLVSFIKLIGLGVLNSLSTLADCWIINLVGHICLVSHIHLVGNNGLVGVINHNGLTDLVCPNSLVRLIGHIDQNSLFGLVGLDSIIQNNSFGGLSLVGFSYFVDLISLSGICGISGFVSLSFVGYIGLVYLVGFIGLVGHNGLVGRIVNQNGLVDRNDLVNHNGLVGCNDLINHIGLDPIGHNGLINGFIGLGVSFIGLGFVGFIALGLVGIARLIGHTSLVGLSGFSGISGLVGRISLVSPIGLVGLGSIVGIGGFSGLSLDSLFIIAIIRLISSSTLVDCWIIIGFIGGFVGLGRFISDISLIGFVSLIGSLASSAHWLIGFGGFAIRSVAAIIAATANLSVVVRKQATRGVAAFFVALCNCDHLAMAGTTTT